jgi:hypothetical protein
VTDLPSITESLSREFAAAEAIVTELSQLSREQCDRALATLKVRYGIKSPGLPTPTTTRGTAKQAATILGLKPRKLQLMSQRGEIPGAAKLGRQWTYDLAKLRRFVEQQEQVTACQKGAKPRPDATGAAKFSGAALRATGSASGGRLKRMIQQSQERAGRREKRE